MPYIPPFSSKQSALPQGTPNVQGGNPLAGETADAYARLAGGLSKIATEIGEKRQQASDQSFLLEKQNLRLKEVDDYYNKLKLESSGDSQGLAKNLQDFIEERSKEDQAAAPSEAARVSYVKNMGDLYGRYMLDATHYENTARATYAKGQIDDSETVFGNLLARQPRLPQDAQEDIQRFKAGVDKQRGVTILDNEANERIRKGAANLATQYFEGIYSANDAGQYQRGLMELRSEKPGVADYMDPDKRAMLIDRFSDALKARQKSNLAEINRRHNDNLSNAIANGGKQQDQNLYTQVLPELERTEAITKDDRVRMTNEANLAGLAGEKLQLLNTLPQSQFMGVLKSWDGDAKKRVSKWVQNDPELATQAAGQPTFGATERNQYGQKLAVEADQLLKYRKDDPVGYVSTKTPLQRDATIATLNNPSAVRSFVAKAIEEQRRLQIPGKPRVLTNDQADSYAKALSDGKNPQAQDQFLTQMQVAYGGHFDDAIQEMISREQLDPLYRIAAQTADHNQRMTFLGAITAKKATDQEFKDTHQQIDEDALTEAVNKGLEDYRAAMNAPAREGQNLNEVSRWATVIKTAAKTQMNTNPGMDEKTAVDVAMRGLRSEKPLLHAADSVVLFKPEPGVNPTLVQAFMQSNLRKFSILHPSTWGDQTQALRDIGVGIPQGIDKDDEQKFLSQVISTGQWVSNPALDGLRLQYRDLSSGKMKYVGGLDGTPLEFKYRDIVRGRGISASAFDRMMKEATPLLQQIAPPSTPDSTTHRRAFLGD